MSARQDAIAIRPADRLDLKAVLVLVVCCVCWGLNQPAIKIANEGISPILQVGLRSLPAALLVVLWARMRGVRLLDRDGTLWPGILSGLLFAGEFVALYIGVEHTTASRGIVFLYLAPFVIAIGSHYLVAGDRLSGIKIVGLTTAFAGLGVAMAESFAAPGRPTLLGDLLCVAAAVFWGVTIVLVRATSLRSVPPEKTLLYQLAVSGIVLVPASWLVGEPGIMDLTGPVLAAFAYTTAIVAFATYVAWFWLVQNYPPTRVAAFSFLTPVFGVVAGNAMLGEPFTISLAVALVFIALGIYLVNRPPQAR